MQPKHDCSCLTTEDPSYQELDKILEEYKDVQGSLITILQKAQILYNYLPRDVIKHISKKTGITQAKIYGVATFYENFSLSPKGKYIIKICDGTACHVRKSIPILNCLRDELDLSEEKATSDDLMFTVETVSCLGACGLAPVITVNDKVYGAMTPDKTKELLAELKKEDAENDK